MKAKAAVVLVSLAALAAPLLARPAGAAEDRRDENVLVVTGNGENRITPDRALVTLGVTTRADKAAPAIQENNRIMQDVVTAIRGRNVPDRSIRTATYNVSWQYEPVGPQPTGPKDTRQPKLVYVVTNTVSVRLDNPALAGPVVDAATGAGANQVQGISFFVEKEQEARQAALRDAVRDAQSKADAIAGALGVRLLGVENVQESGAGPVYPMQYEAMAAEPGRAGAAAPVFAGENTIRASVTIRYRIGK